MSAAWQTGGRGSGGIETYSPFAPPSPAQPGAARPDGRDAGSLRPPVINFGLISQAAGSAYIELGHTKVLCGVYGPRESTRAEAFSDEGRLHVDVKLCTFARPHLRGAFGQGAEERELSQALLQALRGAVLTDTFPKSFVDVYVLVLQADGAELPGAVMAASLALAHAGVACRDLVAACTVAQLGEELLLDPTPAEVAGARAAATVTALPAAGGATSVTLRGLWAGPGGAEEAVETALDACAVLDQALRGALQAATQPQAAAALAVRTQPPAV